MNKREGGFVLITREDRDNNPISFMRISVLIHLNFTLVFVWHCPVVTWIFLALQPPVIDLISIRLAKSEYWSVAGCSGKR